ncbi:MAG TPA: hypothetical protein VGM54_18050 [Chthoniobacter sp.]|jgi:hypothetical protein
MAFLNQVCGLVAVFDEVRLQAHETTRCGLDDYRQMPSTRAHSLLTIGAMSKLFLGIFLFVAMVALPSCSLFHKKEKGPTSHLYKGDAPTLRFTDHPEKPGGDVSPY